MSKYLKIFMILCWLPISSLGLTVPLAGVANAGTITIINYSPCFQWVQIQNNAGKSIIGANLEVNAQHIKDRNNTSLATIKAGPTASADDPKYSKRVNIQPNLTGTTWRIEIHPDRLKIIDGDNGWIQVVDQPANLSRCKTKPGVKSGSSSDNISPKQ